MSCHYDTRGSAIGEWTSFWVSEAVLCRLICRGVWLVLMSNGVGRFAVGVIRQPQVLVVGAVCPA